PASEEGQEEEVGSLCTRSRNLVIQSQTQNLSQRAVSFWLPFLFAEHDSLNGVCPAGDGIAVNQNSAETRIAFGGFKTGGKPCKEALEDLLLLNADDAVIRAGHANIGLISRAFGQNTRVGRRHVGMGAQNGGDSAVEIPAHGDFF